MSRFLGFCLLGAILALAFIPDSRAGVITGEEIIIGRRGDADHSGAVNISDASFLGNYLNGVGHAPPCMNEADVDHDGYVNSVDIVYLLNWLFGQGAAPPAPGPYATTCSESSEPTISCLGGCD